MIILHDGFSWSSNHFNASCFPSKNRQTDTWRSPVGNLYSRPTCLSSILTWLSVWCSYASPVEEQSRFQSQFHDYFSVIIHMSWCLHRPRWFRHWVSTFYRVSNVLTCIYQLSETVLFVKGEKKNFVFLTLLHAPVLVDKWSPKDYVLGWVCKSAVKYFNPIIHKFLYIEITLATYFNLL